MVSHKAAQQQPLTGRTKKAGKIQIIIPVISEFRQ
jgi:hypothetical protein